MVRARQVMQVIAMVAAGLCINSKVFAAASDAERDAQIAELQRQVSALVTRIEVLEQGGTVPPPAANPPAAVPVPAQQVYPGGAKDARNWDSLKAGMTAGEVERLLGAADRSKTIRKFEYWYYGEGKVVFYLGRVDSWATP